MLRPVAHEGTCLPRDSISERQQAFDVEHATILSTQLRRQAGNGTDDHDVCTCRTTDPGTTARGYFFRARRIAHARKPTPATAPTAGSADFTASPLAASPTCDIADDAVEVTFSAARATLGAATGNAVDAAASG